MSIPNHVAIIPDGNRRAARSLGLLNHALYGSRMEQSVEILSWLKEVGVQHVSAFAISSENVVNRTKVEVIAAYAAIEELAKMISQANGFAVHLFGDLEATPSWVPNRQALLSFHQTTAEEDGLTVHLGVNYSGLLDTRLQNDAEPTLSSGVPSVDLLVRSGGQQRLSGFLPYQTQYAELYFSPILWPDFGKPEMQIALDWFADQKRNFGK